jgi:hypothetical protein
MRTNGSMRYLFRPHLMLAAALFLGACDSGQSAEQQTNVPLAAQGGGESAQVLAANIDRLMAYADSIEQALRPVPLLTNPQINAFTRFRNADQLRAAQRLGVPQPLTETTRQRMVQEGRLVMLEDNEYWSVRDLEHSVALATPDVHALMVEIGQRFHQRLERLGLPPLRLEVTSVLRTAEQQADLRQTNPNAAMESTHLYGTTIDIAYSSFVAPLEPVVDLDLRDAHWMEPHLRRIEVLAAETGAARMSRELQAELGHVLREMQSEGKVMVTMEVRQPVYHMTVARRY